MKAVHRIVELDPDRRVARLRDWLAGFLIPEAGARYALKPNISSERPAHTGATTDLDLVRAVAEHLLDHGATPLIVELPPHIRNLGRVVSLTGYAAMARQLDINLVVPDHFAQFVQVGKLPCGSPCRVARAAWEARGIINIPKVKTHLRTHFSAAVKNIMGLADMPTRHRIHLFGLHRGIARLYELVAPRILLNILDGGVMMHGMGPTRGEPLELGLLVLASDAVEADRDALAATGIQADRVRHLGLLGGGSEPAGERLVNAMPVNLRPPRLDYVREALTTQPTLRRLLQRVDLDFITHRRPVLPPGGSDLDALCPHGAIRRGVLLPELCNQCLRCLGPGSPLSREEGAAHKLRVLRELFS